MWISQSARKTFKTMRCRLTKKVKLGYSLAVWEIFDLWKIKYLELQDAYFICQRNLRVCEITFKLWKDTLSKILYMLYEKLNLLCITNKNRSWYQFLNYKQQTLIIFMFNLQANYQCNIIDWKTSCTDWIGFKI